MNVIAKFRRWREEANANKQKFVWQLGVLGFGLTFGLFMAIYQQLTDLAGLPLLARAIAFLLMLFVVGPITGWIWGQLMWALRPWWAPQPASDPPGD
jgi:hypothetical protein